MVELNRSETLAEWDPDLADSSTAKYILYSDHVTNIIDYVYEGLTTLFYTSTILGFAEGSIIVTYQLDFSLDEDDDEEVILQMLLDAADVDSVIELPDGNSITLDLTYGPLGVVPQPTVATVGLCYNKFRLCPGTKDTCVPEHWFCDKLMDCPDWRDEDEDVCGACISGELRCGTSYCIDSDFFCDDTIYDCPDNYDEDSSICDGSCLAPSGLLYGELISPLVGRTRYLEGQTFSFSCNSGYTLVGNSTLTCVGGILEGTYPECYFMCSKPDPPSNGEWIGDLYIDHGDTVQVSCNEGFELQPATPTIFTCNDGQFPSEVAKHCADVEECTTEVDDCDVNADCVNSIGSFMCLCKTGYEGNGTTCQDIDECTEETDECTENAGCSNTIGSYTCSCNEGYQGDGIFCGEILYFPYGDDEGDSRLRDVNFRGSNRLIGEYVSDMFRPGSGFPYGTSFIRNIYFTENGIFVLQDNDDEIVSYPNPPVDGFESSDSRNIIAPFWSDGDFDDVNIGDVFFKEYTSDTSDGRSFISIALARLTDLYQDTIPTDFAPSWALKVTWYDIPQRPVSADVDRRNSFQATLITDGLYSFALFFYEERKMNWDSALESPVDAVIGYNIANYLNQNYQLQQPLSSERYRPDEVLGNSNQMGQWAIRFESNTAESINPKKRCIDWYADDILSDFSLTGLGTCPCGLLQAVRDGRFRFAPRISVSSTSQSIDALLAEENISSALFSTVVYLLNSAQGYSFCFQSATFNFDLAGTECCYRLYGFSLIQGYLGIGSSSFVYRYGYTFGPWLILDQYVKHISSDILPRYYCCYDSRDPDLCNMYFDRRPAANCLAYRPPNIGWMFGDPHIATNDGYEYTFNGYGEYLCSDVNNGMFELQCRMGTPISDPDTKATIFSGFLGKHTGESDTYVQFTLNNNGSDINLLINGTIEVTVDELREGSFSSMSDPAFSLFLREPNEFSSGNERVYASWSTGVAFGVAVTEQMLDILVEYDVKYKGLTSGLFGVWNDDVSDDVCSRIDNQCLDTNTSISDSALFDVGNTWRLSEDESIFVYPEGESYADYNNETFQPLFLDELEANADSTLAADAGVLCGNNTECLFDVLATGSLSIGASTKATEETNINDMNTLENVPPVINNITDLSNSTVLMNKYELYVQVNQTVVLEVSATDGNDDVLEYSTEVEYPDFSMDRTTGMFTWTPTTVDFVNITFDVSDGVQTTSYTMEVRMCSCVNGGQCDFNDLLDGSDISNDKFAVVQCICSAAWTGFDCSEDYDACMEEPCHTGVICQDNLAPEVNSTCASCPSGLEGDGFKCYDYDECTHGEDQVEGVAFCEHTELCENTLGSYVCNCRSGYELHPNTKDCLDIDECDRNTDDCDGNANCNNTAGGFQCTCNEGYTGDGTTCNDIDECQTGTYPCSFNAECSNNEGSFSCVCHDGFSGNGITCDDIDECRQETSECSENADCTNIIASYMCNCKEGFIGNGTYCTDVDECEGGTTICHSRANCTNSLGSYTCTCISGYVGDGSSCLDINECLENPDMCKDLEECVNTESSYFCRCIAGYDRETDTENCTNVDECIPVNGIVPCSSLSTCLDNEGSFSCECNSGYTGNGVTCIDVDECDLGTSDCSQVCVNMEGSYNCSCMSGFELTSDLHSCTLLAGMNCSDVNPCDASAFCLRDDQGDQTCFCNSGYELVNNVTCENIDECVTGAHSCETNCTDTEGSYNCSCDDGYQLTSNLRTCEDIDECLDTSVCITNSECTNVPATYYCSCVDGYTGNLCEDIDECDDDDLYNCTDNYECMNQEGDYRCVCKDGFSGNEIMCVDINECLELDSCPTHSTCNNTVGSFTCDCIDGYTDDGMSNCTDIDECSDSPCHENAECLNMDGSYLCTCNSGYRGNGFDSCINIDECFEHIHDCHDLATCTDNNGSYTCECNTGYQGSGVNCTDIHECSESTNDCDTNAECINTVGSYTCTCNSGYLSIEGGNARTDQCQDYDECDFNIDSCSDNALCANTIGSYTCSCNAGFQGDGLSCLDIDECRELISPCDIDADERCVNTEGAFYCTCQTSFFNVSGECIEAMSRNLLVDFEYIEGLNANMFFQTFDFDEIALSIATDMDNLFSKSVYAESYFGTETISFTNVTIGIRGMFIVTFNKELNITDDQLLQVFLDGLTGRDNDILEPDNKVITEDAQVIEPDIDHCFEGTDDCRDRLFQQCEFTGNGTFECYTCYSGYELNGNEDACIDIDECTIDDPCPEFTTCNNTMSSYICLCQTEGYVAVNAECVDYDECELEPCSVNEVCNNTVGSYLCECDTGYMQDNDECIDINECLVNETCGLNEVCVNTNGGYNCECDVGYVPENDVCSFAISYRGEIRVVEVNQSEVAAEWDTDLEDSTSDKYISYAYLISRIIDSAYQELLSSTFFTSSVIGFKEGSIIVAYQLDFFTNSIYDGDALLQILLNTTIDDVLSTTDGYSVTLDLQYDAVGEELPIECTDASCSNNGNCSINELLERICSCDDGYYGDACENCYNSNCNEAGNCSVAEGSKVCTCDDGYYGDACGNCYNSYCNEAGTCSVVEGSRVCTCDDGFYGETCENCYNSYCNEAGNCSVVEDSRVCTCLDTYSGAECEDKASTSSALPAAVIIILSILAFLVLVVVILGCFFVVVIRRRNLRNIFRHQKGSVVRNPAAGLSIPSISPDVLENESVSSRLSHLANVLRNAPYVNERMRTSVQTRTESDSQVSSDQFIRPYVATGMEASQFEYSSEDLDEYQPSRYLENRARRNQPFTSNFYF